MLRAHRHRRNFLLNGDSEDRPRTTISSALFARFRAPDALIRFGCISPQSATRLWVIKSTAPTSSCISVSSKRDGPMSSSRSFYCHDMPCTRQNSPSRTSANGPASFLLILPTSVAEVFDHRCVMFSSSVTHENNNQYYWFGVGA